jgi:hypothetical protein
MGALRTLVGHRAMSEKCPEAVMPFSFAFTFRFEVMGTRGRLADYHVSAKNSRGGPAETDL